MRKEDCIKIGYVSKSHNLQGEVVITSDNDLLEKYMNEPVFIHLDGGPVPFFITEDGLSVRNHNSYIVKFDFVDTLEQAEQLIGSDVLLEYRLLDQEDVEEDENDIFKIAGFSVKDENIKETGTVMYVSDYSGNIVLTIEILKKEILLPLAERYISDIDFKHKIVHTKISQEIIDLY